MSDELFERLRGFTKMKPTPNLCSPATQSTVEEAECKLGFVIPALLKRCYLEIGNGGFGPGYGLIGVEGGYTSDYGDLVQTVVHLKSDQESEGGEWQEGLLPFCEWGCSIYSCVDCNDPRSPVYTLEEFAIAKQNYTLAWFFELWMGGVDILSHDGSNVDEIEVTNPFTGGKQTVSKRR